MPLEENETEAQVIFEPGKHIEAPHYALQRQMKEDLNRFLVWLHLGDGHTFHVDEPPPIPSPIQKGGKRMKLRRFTELEVIGPFNVKIRPTGGRQHISIKGPKQTLQHLSAVIQDNRLKLEIDEDAKVFDNAEVLLETDALDYLVMKGDNNLDMRGLNPKNFYVDLATTGNVLIEGKKIGLRKLELDGSANIIFRGVSSKALTIESNRADKVAIEGVARLTKLFYGDKSRISVFWVDSPELQIIGSGVGFVRLAGHVSVLEARTYNHATLDAKYLRASKSFVKSYNASNVHLQTIKEQNVLASNGSNVYYYNPSKLRSGFMSESGNVFDNLAFNRY